MGNVDNKNGVHDSFHDHIDGGNIVKVSVEYRVYDPYIRWKKMKHEVGEC